MIRVKIPKVNDFDPFYWRIPKFQHAFLELIRAWAENGFIELEETDDCFCWWDNNILLFDCDQTQFVYDQKIQKNWKGRRTAQLTLFGNEKPFCDFFHRSWIYWSYHPKKLDQYFQNHRVLSYQERKIDLVFAGRAENDCQEIYRCGAEPFLQFIDRYLTSKYNIEVHALMRNNRGEIPNYVWNPEEYMYHVSNAKYGLSIRGNGPSCYREIEYLALGTVPILTPGCIMHYHDRLEEGLHYFEVSSPLEIDELLRTISVDQWKRCSEAGREWYWTNASLQGSFTSTKLLIQNFEEKKRKLRFCRNIFCYMRTCYEDWLSTWEELDERFLEIGEELPRIWVLHASLTREKVPKKYRERVIRLGEFGSWTDIDIIPPILPDIQVKTNEIALFLGNPSIMTSCPFLLEHEHTWWLTDEYYGILEWNGDEWKSQSPGGYQEFHRWVDCWTEEEVFIPSSISLDRLKNVNSFTRLWFNEQGDPFYRNLGYEYGIRIKDIIVHWHIIKDEEGRLVDWDEEKWKVWSEWVHQGMQKGVWVQPNNFPFQEVIHVEWKWDDSRTAEDYGMMPPTDLKTFTLSKNTNVSLPFLLVEDARLLQEDFALDCSQDFHRYFLKQLWRKNNWILELSSLENLRNIGNVWRLQGMSESKSETIFVLSLIFCGKRYELKRKLKFEAYLLTNYVFTGLDMNKLGDHNS